MISEPGRMRREVKLRTAHGVSRFKIDYRNTIAEFSILNPELSCPIPAPPGCTSNGLPQG